MQVLRLCAGIYLFVDFKWRDTGWEQKCPVTSEQFGREKKEKASERNGLPHYAFLMPVSLFPLLMPFTPFHHFPLGSDKEELALVTLFSTPPFSPPVSVSCFSLLPSILSLFPLFPSYVSVPFSSIYLAFFPLFPSALICLVYCVESS